MRPSLLRSCGVSLLVLGIAGCGGDGGQAVELAGTFTISDGAKLGSKGNVIEVGSTAEVVVTLPAGWGSGEGNMSIMQNVNGDGIADFCIGSQNQPCAVLVTGKDLASG